MTLPGRGRREEFASGAHEPGERRFYVDDERSLISIGRRQLEAPGHEVRTFGDPAGALAAVPAAPRTFESC